MDEVSVARRFAAGDEAALGEAMRLYGPRLYALLRRMTRSHAEADDLVQEAFLQAWEARTRLQELEKFFAWLRRIAANLAINAMRARRSSHLVPVEETLPDPATTEDATALDTEIAHTFLERLPPRQREALKLWLEELTYEDIAQAMDCSIGAAKAHVHQAVSNLKRILGAAEPRRNG
jgi:RNA polymerase sigma-70 factor (ECF subfamily)